MPRVSVNGVDLYYEARGSGAPILCIHGTGSSTALWTEAAETLARRGRAIVYDRRGFGRSERPQPLRMDVRLHADDAAELLDALDAAPAAVIGRSHGGEVALDLALRHPDHVRALVLLEGGGLQFAERSRAWLADHDARVVGAGEQAAAEAMLRSALGDEGWDSLPEQARQIVVDNGPAIVAEYRGGYVAATPGQLSAVSVPALVVAAEESPPELGEAMAAVAAALPSARLERVGGGHMIDPAHAVVLDFLEEVLD